MVRYSVTMDDELTTSIDKSCERRKISRSEWINEACTTHLSISSAMNTVGATTLPSAGHVFGHNEHNMPDYNEMYRSFKIDVP